MEMLTVFLQFITMFNMKNEKVVKMLYYYKRKYKTCRITMRMLFYIKQNIEVTVAVLSGNRKYD